MNKRVLAVAAGVGVLTIGLLGNTAKDMYKVISETKKKQKEIEELRKRQKELIKEFKECEMDSERQKELIKEMKECNNELMKHWEQQLAK